MIERKQILDFVKTLPNASTDRPFPMDFDSTVLRHQDTQKWFGIVLRAPCKKVGGTQDGETDVINLKCDPLMSYGLIEAYEGIVPAYHMNKYHWITVVLNSDVPIELLRTLILTSYELTARRRSR